MGDSWVILGLFSRQSRWNKPYRLIVAHNTIVCVAYATAFVRFYLVIPKKNTTFASIYNLACLNRKTCIWILRIALMVCAYGYLLYRLITFDGYAALWERFVDADWRQYQCLTLCAALMPLNLWLEACKWQRLMGSIQPMTMREAQIQVYYGMIGAFATPYRVGDYPARIVRMHAKERWASIIGMGAIGSCCMTMVIVLLGMSTAWLFFGGNTPASMLSVYITAAVCMLLLFFAPQLFRLLARIPWLRNVTHGAADQLAQVSYLEVMRIMWLSFLRYVCFCLQMYLALRFCGISLPFAQACIALPTYYLLITVTPNIPAADFGVRGSWAIYVLGHFVPDLAPAGAIATGLIWMVNTAIPLIIGAFVVYYTKQQEG